MGAKKILKRIAIAIAALIVVCITASFFALRSRAFHRYALAVMVRRAEQATGGRVQIGDFTFHLSGLRVDLYRVAIHGTEPDPTRPLLWVDHAGVKLEIVSLLERKLRLRAVEIDHPVVHLMVSTDGHSNLPQPPPSKRPGKLANTLFSLAIDHFGLHRGDIDFNDRQIPLEAELRHLQVQTDFDAPKTEYDGSLAYSAGEVQAGKLKPLPHSLVLRFSANPGGLRAGPLVVRTRGSQVSIQATLKNYSHPSVDGSYSAALSTAEAARALNSATIPGGEIDTRGVFAYQSAPKRALLDSLSLTGRISSPRLSFRLPEGRGQFLAVKGQYKLEQGNLIASGLEADVLGGRLRAGLAIRNLSGIRRGSLTASVRSMSLASLRAALPNNRWARFPVDGKLSASGRASWHGNLAGLHVRSDASLQGALGAAGSEPGAQAIPLQGTIYAVYGDRVGVLTLRQTVLRTPQSEVDLNGSLGPRTGLAIVARSSDLRETDALIARVRRFASTAPSTVALLGIAGSGAFQGTLQGPIQSPRLSGQFTANNLKVQQASFPHVQTQLAVSASQLALRHGELRAAQGNARFQALVALRNWAYRPSGPAALQLTASRMSVADLESLVHVSYPVSGIISAQISVHGSLSHPAGAGTVQIVKGEAWRQPIQNVTLRFQGTGNAVQSAVQAQIAGGNASANVTYYPQRKGYQGQLSVQGLRLQQLRTLQPEQIGGVLTASVRGQGTLNAPQMQASLSIPIVKIGQQTITGVSAQAAVRNRIATFTLSSSFSGILAHANGTVDLQGDYPASAKLNTGTIEAGPLLANYLPGGAGNIQCQTEVQAWLRGPLKDRQKLQAGVELPALRLAYQSVHVASVSTITADYQNGTLVLKPAEIKGTGTDFRFQAAAPLEGNGPVNASAAGTVDLRIIQIFDPGWDGSGQLRINVGASGSRSHPKMQGRVQVVNAALEPPSGPIGVQNVNATIALTSTRAEITTLTAESGGGSVTASGSVSYAHGIHFDLALNADHVRVRYPQGVREVLGSKLRLAGTPQAALLSGQVSIDGLSFTPQFDLASFANQFNALSTPGAGAGFASRVKLNVAVRSAQELALRSAELSLRGAADLRVQGTLADPVVVGRATLAGGELLFNANRYRVESGVVDFVNPVMTEPVVNIRVTTTVEQYDVTLNFTGPFDRIRTTYSSSPALAPADIISLLIAGQPTEAQGTGLGAGSLLTQGITSPVSSRVQKLTGLSSLTIDPQVGGYNTGVNIALQQRVTKNLFFTFSTNTATTQDAVVQVEYQFSRKWSVEALRDQNGDYSLEIRSRKAF